jgi:hypothetical protein
VLHLLNLVVYFWFFHFEASGMDFENQDILSHFQALSEHEGKLSSYCLCIKDITSSFGALNSKF